MSLNIFESLINDKMQKEKDDSSLKSDYLAAYHTILFSKTSGNEIDVERRRLAVKYMTARKFESEDAAAILLRQGLKQYESKIEKAEFLNKIDSREKKIKPEWKTSLEDVEQGLAFVKPLICQRKSSDRVCCRRELVDRDAENVMKLSEDRDESKVRKVRYMNQRFVPQSYSRFEQDRSSSTRDNLQNDCAIRKQRRNGFERTEEEEYSRQDDRASKSRAFRTAKVEFQAQQQQKQAKKSLGGKAAVNSKFVCPFKREKEREEEKKSEITSKDSEPEDERLRGIDEKLIELVRNEIMDSGTLVSWDDVAGLEHAKKIIKEIVVLPMLRPDIFTGLRRPPKGILLFGPPGTGKTLIGKCIASQSKSTFFSISASSLTSKWIGEGEKMVRALFAVARVHQPSVIFIDEIDSLLTQRSETEHESSRRIKTEFLVQLDGAATGEEDRILVIGATNRPQELDEAARRRFVKRLYVPLPEFQARRQIVENLLATERHELNSQDIENIAHLSEHYSGADMTNLCKEASMGPIRCIPFEHLENIRKEDVRCVTAEDFNQALTYVRPSVSQSDLGLYVNWDRTYGSGTASINCSKT